MELTNPEWKWFLLYSYMNGDYSSRSMELNCKRDINFMFLLEGSPALDHNKIQKGRTGTHLFPLKSA